MTIVDLVERGEGVLRYHTKYPPKAGETISTFKPTLKTWEVLTVNHLIKLRRDIAEEPYMEELITVEVKRTT